MKRKSIYILILQEEKLELFILILFHIDYINREKQYVKFPDFC